MNDQPLKLASQDSLKQELQILEPTKITKVEVDPSLDYLAQEYVTTLLTNDNRNKKLIAVEELGSKIQKEASHHSKMLKAPIKELYNKEEKGDDVGSALLQLRDQVEDLNPNNYDLSAPGFFTKTLGLIPFVGTPMKKYFSKYNKAGTVIDAIVHSLKEGQARLRRDNGILMTDQQVMREMTKKLEKTIQLGQLIDQKLEYAISRQIEDEEEKKFIQEELLFAVRQRIGDLQQQCLVNQQGVVATELIIRNNKELIRGVDRTIMVTVNALEIAVALNLALNHQKKVIDTINATNETTSNLLMSTSEKIKTQGVEIHKQAASSSLDVDKLKTAFDNINQAMDDISTFKQEALPQMKTTIDEFEKLAEKGEKMIKQFEKGNSAQSEIVLEIED